MKSLNPNSRWSSPTATSLRNQQQSSLRPLGHVYETLRDEFGEMEVKPRKQEQKEKTDKQLEELRNLKKELRRTRKVLLRSSIRQPEAERLVNKRWFEVVHEHSRLSKALKERRDARNSKKQQGRFRADPMGFGKGLFEKTVTGDPAFESKEAFNYFSQLYREEARGDPVEPLPSMTRPLPPKNPMSEDPPSREELSGVIKLKRNAASPGIDGLTLQALPLSLAGSCEIVQKGVENERCACGMGYCYSPTARKVFQAARSCRVQTHCSDKHHWEDFLFCRCQKTRKVHDRKASKQIRQVVSSTPSPCMKPF